MKRMLTLLLTVLLLACGCSQKPTAGFTADDLQLSVDGTAYRCGTQIETVIAGLGEDYEYAEGKSCAYDGLDKTYTYETVTFFTNPLAEGDTISEIYSESETVTTSKGITVGAAKSEVTAAYGAATEDANNMLIYRLPDRQESLCFELVDDRVIAIFLTMEAI